MKKINRFGRNVSAASMALGLVLAASPAFAQAAPADAEASNDVIIVTGSRIAQPNTRSASPITTITAEDLKVSGATRVEDLINQLPQAFVSQSSTVSNGSDGTATANLRNLGDTRTLVLVNGLRLPPGDPVRSAGSLLGSAADLNNIPSILVKRVDVLTGGASAAYGADAVAGVVNFILDDDFQGVKFDAKGSLFQHQNGNGPARNAITTDPRFGAAVNPITYQGGNTVDGGTYDVGAAIGSKFGDDNQGHFSVFANYHHQAPILLSSRDYGSCPLASNEIDNGPGAASTSKTADLYCLGSTNSAQTSVLANGGSGGGFGTLAGTRLIFIPGAVGVRTFNQGTDGYNYNSTPYFQRPDQRYNVGAFADYEINEHFKPYVNFLFMDDHSFANIAPSGTFNNVFTINCSNPLLTASQGAALGCAAPGPGSLQTVTAALAKRNVEGGARSDDLRHTDYRIVGGMKGEIDSVWSYDAHYQYGTTIYNEHYLNDFSRSRAQNAINACLNPNGTAVADQTCVPYNIFRGTTSLQTTAAAGVTQAAINYVSTPGFKTGQIKQQVAAITFQGDLGQYGLKSPFAADGVRIAFGPEYRKESLRLDTDAEFTTGDLLGQGGQTKSSAGTFDVKEAFIEASVPLASDVSGFQSLVADAAYRYSDYSTVGHTNTWKISLDWSPFSGDLDGAFRLRGSINRAVRAPTLQDYYAPSQLGLGGSFDTCAQRSAGRVSAGSLASCLNTASGDPNFAAQFAGGLGIARNPASQYNTVTSGGVAQGANIGPETAITKTVGAVFQPRHYLPGFFLSVDYFNINLNHQIGTDGYTVIFNQCYNTGSAYYCSLIHRDPSNGSLWLTPNGYINDPVYNKGHQKTDGIDINATYSYDAGKIGRFNASLQGTYTRHFKNEVIAHNPNGSTASNGYYDCVGFYDDGSACGVPTPRWRHKLRVTYTPQDAFSVSVAWRHIGSTTSTVANQDMALDGSGPLIGIQGYSKADIPNSRIPNYDYFDLAVTVHPSRNLQLQIGVNNIADRQTPVLPGGEYNVGNLNGNTFAGYYDGLGRYLFAGVTLQF